MSQPIHDSAARFEHGFVGGEGCADHRARGADRRLGCTRCGLGGGERGVAGEAEPAAEDAGQLRQAAVAGVTRRMPRGRRSRRAELMPGHRESRSWPLPASTAWLSALADMACDAREFRSAARAMGAIPVVPSRKGAKQPLPCLHLPPPQPHRPLLVAPQRAAGHRHALRQDCRILRHRNRYRCLARLDHVLAPTKTQMRTDLSVAKNPKSSPWRLPTWRVPDVRVSPSARV